MTLIWTLWGAAFVACIVCNAQPSKVLYCITAILCAMYIG